MIFNYNSNIFHTFPSIQNFYHFLFGKCLHLRKLRRCNVPVTQLSFAHFLKYSRSVHVIRLETICNMLLKMSFGWNLDVLCFTCLISETLHTFSFLFLLVKVRKIRMLRKVNWRLHFDTLKTRNV